jgi:hypothetical protein
MFPYESEDAVDLVRSALGIGNGPTPNTIARLGAGIGADIGTRWASGLAGRRDVFKAVRLIQLVVRRAARLVAKDLKRGEKDHEAPAKVLRSLMRKVEPALPTIKARVSFTLLRDGSLDHDLEWWTCGAGMAATEVAAVALAALLSEEGGLWKRLRTCPECDHYFLKQHKQKMCSPECAKEVHKVKIAEWKRKNI